MALKILLVDPSSTWLDECAAHLNEMYYEVDVALNGKMAQLNIFNNTYFAIVLNLDIQNHSGSQVFRFIKANYPKPRLILTMEQADTLERIGLSKQYFEKRGINEIFVRPYTVETIADALEGHQSMKTIMSRKPLRTGVTEESEEDVADQMFSKVPISQFFSTKAVQYDVYVKVRENRYLKILHAGDAFSQERIDKYKENTQFLFFLAKDRKKFLRFTNFLATKLINTAGVSTKVKADLVKNSAEKFVEELYTEGLKPSLVEEGKTLCANMYDLVKKDQSLGLIMRDYAEFDPSAFSHAFLTTMMASMIVKQFEWESRVINEAIAMAGLMHDIGKLRLSKELIGKNEKQLTPEQLEEYKMHPELGAEMLAGNPQITAAVRQIIIQHHECIDGSGYPSGYKQSRILTLAQILFLADEFSYYIKENSLSPIKGLKGMLSDPSVTKRYNALILEAFINIFADPGKMKKVKEGIF